jgi:hypothetical protein
MFGQAGMFGGYPAAAGYRHNVRNTDLAETFAAQRPYPIAERDTANSEITRLVKGDATRDKRGTTFLEDYRRHDLYLSFLKGGPGLGDPLARLPEDVQTDLDEGVLLPDFAGRVYGAVVKDGEGAPEVDREATEQRRRELLDQRARRAVPVSEWIERERAERVLPREVIAPIADMYRSSMRLSPAWAREFREFWELDEEFAF